MPGPPPAPAEQRRRRNTPAGGEWQNAPGVGWQHGKPPPPPKGLRPEMVEEWKAWFSCWWAAFWTPDDVPMLRRMAAMQNECLRIEAGDYTEKTRPSPPYGEWRQLTDRFGMTPKARLSLRWLPQAEDKTQARKPSRYGHLKAV